MNLVGPNSQTLYICLPESRGVKKIKEENKNITYLFSRYVNGSAYFRGLPLSVNGGARGVMVIVAGCGHGDTSSNPGRDWLHFSHSTNTLGKGMNPNILPPAMGK